MYSFCTPRSNQTKPTQFVRIDELDALNVRPKGEGHGCPESNFCRIAKIDALYVRPKGEGHGCPESMRALD